MLPHKQRKIKATDHLLSSFSYINQLISYITMKSRHIAPAYSLHNAINWCSQNENGWSIKYATHIHITS